MVRKFATVVFCLALAVALAMAAANAHPVKARGASPDFSAPCESSPLAFKAKANSNAVSTVDGAFAPREANAGKTALTDYRLQTVAPVHRLPAPWIFPPLLHRPPPSNS